MRFVWVGVAGAVGSIIRYIIGLSMGSTHFPWATLLVNITGSFFLGFLLTWGLGRLPVAVTTPIAVGLLGGFTTFSAFAWEGLFMAGSGRAALAASYILASVTGGLLAALAGRVVGQALI